METPFINKRPLIPRTILDVDGKLSYSESLRSWNTIRLKKDLVNEFPQLSEKRANFSYKLVYSRDLKAFEAILKNFKEKDNLPILLFLYRDV